MSAPIHDFPIRDEILWQFGPTLDGRDVLEVGSGSGYTAWRVEKRARKFWAADCAEDTVRSLFKNRIIAVLLDFTGKMPHIKNFMTRFDVVYSLDMLECVPKGTGSQVFTNMFNSLRGYGELFVTFPNHEKFPNHYETIEQLCEEIIGCNNGEWQCRVFTVELNPWAQFFYKWGHDKPLDLWRRLRGGNPSTMNYDSTWAFQNRGGLEKVKWLIHGYWAVLMFVIKMAGPAFRARVTDRDIVGKQIVIRAWK